MARKPRETQRRRTKEEYIEALEKAKGLTTVAGDILGVVPEAVSRMIAKHPEVRAARDRAAERVLDFAENRLYDQIADGNTAATIFFLKTKGRNRGYVEKLETGGTINVVFEYADEPVSRPDPEGQT